MSKKLKLTLILIIAAAVIAALALPKIGLFEETKKESGPAIASRDMRMKVKTQTLSAARLGSKVATVGTILSNEEVEIRSEISGKVEAIYFKEGAAVRKGEALLKINDDELHAQFLRAKHRQTLAEQQEERQRRLLEKGLVSQAEYDNAAANLNIAKAEAQLIKVQLDKTEIRAPFNGRIGLRYVSEGSYITPSTSIAALQDNSVLKIDFAVPEKYAGNIKAGDTITFGVQGTSRTFSATVYAIQPKIDPSTRTLSLRAIASNPDSALLPGSLATVNISMKEKETLMIPSFALIPELKGHKVFLYKDGMAEERRVEIGARTDELVEVTHGLKPGDTLITSGILQLRPGMPVELEQSQKVKSPAEADVEQGL